ncbi:N-acetyltransferase [Siminovitchia terrae]|uniref:N-acetyltransferase n=1 Tax=Siminovitchia terrae TaxID=1914933 RepID=A0A429X355_SIMTE|nr:GNAT family N-acetyltransferase [Siminovitchia terrae]RST57805.1 GNAT family N-acetyltransferase [Siminovitchia terrae]GIN91130.1 N-acetyltransferase [Siminovitchia terrae]GIN94959.1 N-acetyltransferase [Siminovitchia terrae]
MLADTLRPSVALVEYTEEHDEQLTNYHLSEEQLQFTSMPLDKINDPTVSNSAKHVLILASTVPVGYFALEDGERLLRYSNNSSARLLTAFSIDSRNQGKGLAKIGLQLLPEFVRNNLPGTNEIVLGVNKRNAPAYNLYLKTGFKDENEFYEGTRGPQHILHLRI